MLSKAALTRISNSVKYTESRAVNLIYTGRGKGISGSGNGTGYLYNIYNASEKVGGTWKCQIGFIAEQSALWGATSYNLKPLNGGEPIFEVPEGESEEDYKEYYNGDRETKTNTGDPFIELTAEADYDVYLIVYITNDGTGGRQIEFKIECLERGDEPIQCHRMLRIASFTTENNDESELKIGTITLYRSDLDGWWDYPRYNFIDDTSTDTKAEITIIKDNIRIGGNLHTIENEPIEIKLEDENYIVINAELSSGGFELKETKILKTKPVNSGTSVYDYIGEFFTVKYDDMLYIDNNGFENLKEISYDSDWWS